MTAAGEQVWREELDEVRRALVGLAAVVADLPDPDVRVTAVRVALETVEHETSALLALRLSAIGRLRELGYSYEQIAEATGLSKSRVAQLSRLTARS